MRSRLFFQKIGSIDPAIERHAPRSTVSEVVLHKLSVIAIQFQHVGHFIKAHAPCHELFDIFQQVRQASFRASFRASLRQSFFEAFMRQFFHSKWKREE